MTRDNQGTIDAYDRKYRQAGYYGYRPFLYRPFVRALTRKAGLRAGQSILDVGCGQGFFTGLLAAQGLRATGVDLSSEGIASARRDFGATGAEFRVADIFALGPDAAYDAVFVRSCSLYNDPSFGESDELTDVLLSYLKPGGCLIFVYNTNLCPWKKSVAWLYHSYATARRHFARYASARTYFTLRFAAIPLGALAFSRPLTMADSFLSRVSGAGGDLVVFVRK